MLGRFTRIVAAVAVAAALGCRWFTSMSRGASHAATRILAFVPPRDLSSRPTPGRRHRESCLRGERACPAQARNASVVLSN
jgi:hypothetical protein